jgi:hypothetical protein
MSLYELAPPWLRPEQHRCFGQYVIYQHMSTQQPARPSQGQGSIHSGDVAAMNALFRYTVSLGDACAKGLNGGPRDFL